MSKDRSFWQKLRPLMDEIIFRSAYMSNTPMITIPATMSPIMA